ncbi:hypothetical protein [Nitrosomonas ureae]|uniref:Uncharacterized protein n=1 Tax=Nitrosomonas ureae TaxID=44577 RepID=A0A1H9D0B8_9PROT|nr:hypothetical protein [Nitrosomonas ureae]SEQ06895.1 hypothetical protein SAMN05421510_101823 [Nitrosomonas ureae]
MFRQYSPLKNGRRTRQANDDETSAAPDMQSSDEGLSDFYSTGPVIHLGGLHNKDTTSNKKASSMNDQENTMPEEPMTLTTVQGTGQTRQVSAHGKTLRLEGRTDASYDGGAFRTEKVRLQRGTGCDGCEAADCGHVTGTLVATYSVATTVTLPRVTDFPDLTPCQRTRVQNAITNILAPHEQQHVTAFRQYNGTTRRQFDLTLCRSEFDSTIRAMFEAEESARRATAQAASDALDPFHFDVDLNCKDSRSPRTGGQQSADFKPVESNEK